MKPVAFEYTRPTTLAAAAALLGEPQVFSKALAGGQSLGPMLNLRLAQPDLLIDITSIPELTAVADGPDHVELGACITHADIEDGRVPDPAGGLLRHVAGRIAYRAVRNRGTIGGSLTNADPSADWVSTLGTRTVPPRLVHGRSAPCLCAPRGLSRHARRAGQERASRG